MKVQENKTVRGYIRMCADGWKQGWHERNGGNLTYRMRPEETEAVSYTHLDVYKRQGKARGKPERKLILNCKRVTSFS